MSYHDLESYNAMSRAELKERITAHKQKYADRLLILTHHYQRDEIIQFGDMRGDSLMLARESAESNADFIVFCGVHFMAESSGILTKNYQKVHLPAPDAGCPMADMVDMDDLETSWDELAGSGCDVIPILYVNSSADVKAFCGRHNGSVCTSANAKSIIQWGFSQAEKVLFLPDEHLGRNTGNLLQIPPEQMIVWDPALPLGGNSRSEVTNARLILWKGYCHVHTHFTPEHVQGVKARFPDGQVIVHPECKENVVNMADGVGSTSYIEKFVKNAAAGSTIIVGTELNMVSRLAKENPEKNVHELARSICPNMYKTDMPKLLHTLDHLGKENIVHVSDEIRKDALLPLERMLFIQSAEKTREGQKGKVAYSLSK